MKFLLFAQSLALASLLALGARTECFGANSPELAEARKSLLEVFERGGTDNDNEAKQLRAKISALEGL